LGELIRAGAAELWIDRRGDGPEVLLIAGLGDPAEAWEAQLDGLSDRYRLTAFDNRGVGRTPLGDGQVSAAAFADDAADLLDALEVDSAHVAGFSMGSAIAQELALRHPDRVRSLVLISTYARADALFRAQLDLWRWLPEVAPGDREFYAGFFTWVYTPRAYADGSVDTIVEEAVAFPHQQSIEGFHAHVDVCRTHDTTDRLAEIAVPTLVVAGEYDVILPPRCGQEVAAAIPNARFELWPGEAHQPFQEVPDEFNARLDHFWEAAASRA
jgi:pimeloyl-ACP methyl ester carboxylesterase